MSKKNKKTAAAKGTAPRPRVAVIDAGSNSIKYFLGEWDAEGLLSSLADENDVTRLGRGLGEGGALSPEAMERSAAAITRFDLTEFGRYVNYALAYYRRGLYDESAALWQEVLRMNGNFGMAYSGIARALLRQGDYRGAMRYFRINDDFVGYGRAFGFYRRIWVERNFWMFALALGILIIVPPVVKNVRRLRREIREA